MKTKLHLASVICMSTMAALAQPTITQQPADQTANQGYSATFQLRATGAVPLSYAWFFNQSAIAGATTNRLTITNAHPANAGDYFAIASDSNGSVTSRVVKLTVVLPVKLDSKIGPNVLMGEDAEEVPPNGRWAAEPHLTRSLNNGNLIVGVFMEGRFPNPQPEFPVIGYSISRDGGMSWTRSLVENLTSVSGGTFVKTFDPVAAIDLQENIFVTSHTGSDQTFCAISKRPNGAVGFEPPVRVGKVPNAVADKNWIVVNPYSHSPAANRMVVTWTKFDASGAPALGLLSAYSDDGGANWSTPTIIYNSAAQNTQPLFLPDGSLVVLFVDNSLRIQASVSADGGKTYAQNRLVAQIPTYADPRVRNAEWMFAAASDRQAGIIFVAYQGRFGQGADARPAILFTRSIDRGKTWSTPVPVNDTPDKRSVFTPAIAASPDGQHIVIEFYDRRNDSGAGFLADLYLAESFDGGDTWEPNLRVSEFASDTRKAPIPPDGSLPLLGDYIAIVPALGLGETAPAVACWIDTRSGSPDPYSARIQRTRGANLETWRRLRWATNDLTNSSISGPAADPDGDGIANLSEYAVGLEPSQPNSGVLRTRMERNGSNKWVEVSFTRPSVIRDVQLDWEESTDLASWAPSKSVGAQESPPTGFWQNETWRFSIEASGQKFVRLVVKQVSE
ncbi:MAG: exo-alpha-sialidase [Verrucomicrobiales bacterium]|nr:exo-alpha-sialidase [Verrucomicrobiales bacterium]